jgi:hypothetical protein
MTDVDLIWEELLLRFDYGLPESREAFIEEAENVVNEFIEYDCRPLHGRQMGWPTNRPPRLDRKVKNG